MCECCSNNAANHQGHVHVNGIECSGCFGKLEKGLSDIPGIVRVEFVKEAEQAKVVFDRRILDIANLERTIDQLGFAVS